MNKNNIGYAFFIAFIFLAIIIMYQLLKPFGMIIFFAVVFYVILNPLFIKAMGNYYKKKYFSFTIFFNFFNNIFSSDKPAFLYYSLSTYRHIEYWNKIFYKFRYK